MWKDESNLRMQPQNVIGVKFPCKIRLLSDSVTVYAGVKVGSVTDKDLPEILEAREDKESRLWGRLKSGAGWIPLDKAKIIINEQ